MCRRLARVVTLTCLFLLTASAASIAQSCDVGADCSLENLGNNRYRFTWVVTNNGPGAHAVFKWGIDTPNIPGAWTTVLFDLPTGWSGSHPDSHIDFQTANGSGSPNRIFSPIVDACGDGPTLTFRWTFDNNGGATPDCASFENIEYRFHMQPINATTCANNGQSFLCNGLVPVEPATWGAIKNVYSE